MDELKINMGQQGLKETVLGTGLCTGCGACVNLCPYQKAFKDHTIMLFPCDIAEGRCYAYCPRTPTDLAQLRSNAFDPEDLTPEIGAIKAFYITRASDSELRARAQHGGTVSALMRLALEEGIIDEALLSQGTPDLLPAGRSCGNSETVAGLAGSKMVVSPTVAEFNRAARGSSQRIGLVATPCQALALAKMRSRPLENDAICIDKLTLVIGLFCGWAFDWREIRALIASKVSLTDVTGMDIPPSKYHSLEVYTRDGATLSIDLDEVVPCVRPACHYCFDMTAEFSDLAVGSARLGEGWEVARGWNQVIARTQLGVELMERARKTGVLEFHAVPEGNLERLKRASLGKKQTALENLRKLSGKADDLVYLDPRDPVFKTLMD